MAWTTVTVVEVKQVVKADEFGLIESLHAASPDIVKGHIDRIIAELRGLVGNCTTLSTDAKLLPPEVKRTALIILRHSLLSAVAGASVVLDEARMIEYNDAQAMYRALRNCEIKIEPGIPCSNEFTDTDTSKEKVAGNSWGSSTPMAIC